MRSEYLRGQGTGFRKGGWRGIYEIDSYAAVMQGVAHLGSLGLLLGGVGGRKKEHKENSRCATKFS